MQQRAFTYDPDSLASMMRCCFEYFEWRGLPPTEVHQTTVALRRQVLSADKAQRRTPRLTAVQIAQVVTDRVLAGKLEQVLSWGNSKLLKMAKKVAHADDQD